MLAFALFKGIGVVSFSPLNDGNLAREPGTRTTRNQTLAETPFEKKLCPFGQRDRQAREAYSREARVGNVSGRSCLVCGHGHKPHCRCSRCQQLSRRQHVFIPDSLS